MNQFQQQHGQQVQEQEHEQEQRLPTSFICPLTMKIMDDPVMDQCAHNFERQAIVEWLSSSTTTSTTTATTSCCPISNKPLSISDLIPNHTLAERIERWKWLREDSTIDYNYDESIDQHNDIEEGEAQQQQQKPRRQWFPHRKRQIHRSRRAGSKPNMTKQQSKQQQQLEYTSIPTGVPKTNAQTATNSSSIHHHHHPTTATTIDLMLLPQERLALQKIQYENQMKQNEYNHKRMIRTILISIILCIILISCIVLYIRTIQQQQQNNNNDEEGVGVDVGEVEYDMNMTDDKN